MNEFATIRGTIEAILFVAGEAVEVEDIARALSCGVIEVDLAIDRLIAEYEQEQRGFELIRLDDKIQLRTRDTYAGQVQQALNPVGERTLSRSVLETLSIVAYNQPVTRAEIEKIKGTNADYSVRALVSRKLVEPVGRKDAIGRPMMYGTTDEFLRHFGLSSINELPSLETFREQAEVEEFDI